MKVFFRAALRRAVYDSFGWVRFPFCRKTDDADENARMINLNIAIDCAVLTVVFAVLALLVAVIAEPTGIGKIITIVLGFFAVVFAVCTVCFTLNYREYKQ